MLIVSTPPGPSLPSPISSPESPAVPPTSSQALSGSRIVTPGPRVRVVLTSAPSGPWTVKPPETSTNGSGPDDQVLSRVSIPFHTSKMAPLNGLKVLSVETFPALFALTRETSHPQFSNVLFVQIRSGFLPA